MNTASIWNDLTFPRMTPRNTSENWRKLDKIGQLAGEFSSHACKSAGSGDFFQMHAVQRPIGLRGTQNAHRHW
jgi:hypothetical protein